MESRAPRQTLGGLTELLLIGIVQLVLLMPQLP